MRIPIESLMKYFAKMPELFQLHSFRVALYMMQMAEATAAAPADLCFLAGFCHDLGKSEIDNRVLNKPSALSPDEWAQISQHPRLGGQILSKLLPISDVISCAKYHHEKMDGTGYPYRLKDPEIPLMVRICSIADAFDAMTAARPYGCPKTKLEAISELKKGSGTQFDPELVDVFSELIA